MKFQVLKAPQKTQMTIELEVLHIPFGVGHN